MKIKRTILSELHKELEGKAFKVIDEPLLNEDGSQALDENGNPVTYKKAVLDEEAEAQRLADEKAKEDAEALEKQAYYSRVEKLKDLKTKANEKRMSNAEIMEALNAIMEHLGI